MLATRASTVPVGPEWLHEVKWDGMRVVVDVEPGRVRVSSRAGNDVTAAWPELEGLGALGRSMTLDGELVAFVDGRPSFAALAERMHLRKVARARALAVSAPVTLLVFDLLRLDGESLVDLPLVERRSRLEALGLDDVSWQVPQAYDDGAMLLEATRQQGLEGIVSKRRGSPYREGARSKDWLKLPHRLSVSVVVGGWRAETGSRARLGALLVGEQTPDGLRYRGRVGSGVAGRAQAVLTTLLESISGDECPFLDEVPREDALGATWVHPALVVDVESLGLTREGRLRQPAFVRVRTDLMPDDVVGSLAALPPVGVRDA